MKSYRCNRRPGLTPLLCGILLAAITSFVGFTAFAQDPDATAQADNKIHITADRLEVYRQSRYAEFIGQVKAVQGTTVIESDRLRIYYKEGIDNSQSDNSQGDNIEKLIASGNVKIVFDDQIAYTELAEYFADTGVMVLTGPGTNVVSGKNTISGQKITIYRREDRMTVDRGEQNRVQAVFFSEGAVMQ